MKVSSLIELLQEFNGELDVMIDAGFELCRAHPIRKVAEQDGKLILRDYYATQPADILVTLQNGEVYERV